MTKYSCGAYRCPRTVTPVKLSELCPRYTMRTLCPPLAHLTWQFCRRNITKNDLRLHQYLGDLLSSNLAAETRTVYTVWDTVRAVKV